MKENTEPIPDMHQLAEEGWKQMHEILREKKLIAAIPGPLPAKRRNRLFLIAAILFIFLLSAPFIWNKNSHFSSRSPISKERHEAENAVVPVPSLSKAPKDNGQSLSGTKNQKQFFHEKIRAELPELKKQDNFVYLQGLKAHILHKLSVAKDKYLSPDTDGWIDPSITIRKTLSASRKPEPRTPFSKKAQIFAGGGLNISGGKTINLHPGATLIIPLSRKFSLHTGIWAFSTTHGTKVSTQERELVSNSSSSVSYNINTTSIIKASYFDVPVTLHYALNSHWSAGGGLQLSKLYKVSIKEQKEGFDYNNIRIQSTVQQFSASPSGVPSGFQKKVEVKKFEPRLVAETNFRQGRFLLSFGYYYGIGKTIVLKDAVNSSHQYRNEYFKLGVQYGIGTCHRVSR
jgi:hypothetical protein